jgi:hypothetical protein
MLMTAARIVSIILFFALLQNVHSQETIQIDGKPCPMNGSIKDPKKSEYRLNLLKNRYSKPTYINNTITLDSLLRSGKDNQRFSDTIAVRLTGYVVSVSRGDDESCNCNSRRTNDRDTRLRLALSPDEKDPSNSIVAEVTPRMRRIKKLEGIDWSQNKLRKLKGKKVIIEGWLFFDGNHLNVARNTALPTAKPERITRASCWEVHPITKIEVVE